MNDSNGEALDSAGIEWLEDGAPWSPRYGDVYFSREGGLAETRHVFLRGNDLARRWQQAGTGRSLFTIAELGFGTGLNFLACWQLWQQTSPRPRQLHYISCEKHPLKAESLRRALQSWPELENFSLPLLEAWPEHIAGYHRLHLRSRDGQSRVLLDLYYGDAEMMLRRQSNPCARVDAWFLDGFTPARNPELWSDSTLETVARLSAPGATVGSYSVTGRVVRKLRELGFDVEKRKGFGHKRHMLHARRSAPTEPSGQEGLSRQVTVIGAGLAGSCVAWSLAQRGFRVTVLEAETEIARGASGNPQAVLQCRLNRLPDSQWQVNLSGFLYAARFYSSLQQHEADIQWHRCGVMTLDSAYGNTRKKPSADTYDHYPPRILRRVTRTEASRLCGTSVTEGGLFLAPGGWLNPARLCQALLQHEHITVRVGTRVERIDRDGGQWRLQLAGADTSLRTPRLVVANSHAATGFEPLADYPLIPLRGQISFLPASDSSRALNCVLCARSYITPAQDGRHCIGASYVKNELRTDLSEQEHQDVVEGILPAVPALQPRKHEASAGRAGIRGGSGDYMPIAGAVADPDAGHRHSGPQPSVPRFLPDFYISTGHGSHGLASCPLAGEHIASLINGEASPLPLECAEQLSPWRFIARKRKKR